jgi:hypothetical protein
MLNKITGFINQLTEDYASELANKKQTNNSETNPSTTSVPNQGPTIVMPEVKMIEDYRVNITQWSSHANFPKRVQEPLDKILATLHSVDFEAIDLPEQSLIKKIIDREIPQNIDAYLSLPKAHAVSVILENGKTSKDNLIEKMFSFSQQINLIWDRAVEEKTKQLMKQQKKTVEIHEAKKDFFDL